MDPIRDCPHCAHDRCELVELHDQPGEAYAVHCAECGGRGLSSVKVQNHWTSVCACSIASAGPRINYAAYEAICI